MVDWISPGLIAYGFTVDVLAYKLKKTHTQFRIKHITTYRKSTNKIITQFTIIKLCFAFKTVFSFFPSDPLIRWVSQPVPFLRAYHAIDHV